ncbi:MAG: GTP-binding protein [Methanobacteriota archaeon]|nr:MAG: GTP-binding protein [Euryarchaeota archaeon]
MSIIKSKRYIKKVGLIGDSAVGKTSLIRRFVVDVFDDAYIATIGTKVSKRDLEYDLTDKTMYLTLMLWDILGQKDYTKIRTQSMKSSHGMMVVSDLTRDETVESAKDFWFKEARDTLGHVPVVFIGNKADLADDGSEAAEKLKRTAESVGMPAFVCSAKTGENVEDAFRKIGEMMISGDFAKRQAQPEGECGSLAQAVDEIVNDFCEQYGETAKAMDVVEKEFTRAKVNIHNPTKDSLLTAIEYLSDVERDLHGRDISEVNKLRRWKMIDEAR